MNTKGLKQERSIPVQSRIDIKSLAELDEYWRSIGIDIKSMSQLISWSIDAFHEILSNNSLLPKIMETVADCHNHLEFRQLYQGSMKKRAMDKVNAAMRFENLRYEGVDPANYDSREYKIVHNRTSVKPYDGGKTNHVVNKPIRSEVEEYYAEREREKEEEQRANIERQKAIAMKSGRVYVGNESGVSKRNIDRNLEKMKEADEALERF